MIASVAVARAAEGHGFPMAEPCVQLGFPPAHYSHECPRSLTWARAELSWEQNKDALEMPSPWGKTLMWERGSRRGSAELEGTARWAGNLSRDKRAIDNTNLPPLPRLWAGNMFALTRSHAICSRLFSLLTVVISKEAKWTWGNYLDTKYPVKTGCLPHIF